MELYLRSVPTRQRVVTSPKVGEGRKEMRLVGHWKKGQRPDLQALRRLFESLEHADELLIGFGDDARTALALARMFESRAVLFFSPKDGERFRKVEKHGVWEDGDGSKIFSARVALLGPVDHCQLVRLKLFNLLGTQLTELRVMREHS